MQAPNYYSWLNARRHGTAAMDSSPDWDENKVNREAKGGTGGGRFAKKPETLAKEDQRDILDPGGGGTPTNLTPVPSPKRGYRAQRDALAHRLTQDGTYDLKTGNPVSFENGFQVSFQEYTTERPGHGAYIDDDEYDRRVDALSAELGAKPNLARFGEPEISFHVDSLEKALEVARRHNQESVFDWSTFKCIPNKDFVGRAHYADRNDHTGKNYHESKPNPNPPAARQTGKKSNP